MKLRLVVLFSLLSGACVGPVYASDNWLSLCSARDNGPPVQIKDARSGAELLPLKSGDLVYRMIHGNAKEPTLAFRGGKLTEIVPGIDELESKHLVKCNDEASSSEYPVIVPDDPSQGQLIYDNFGIISNFFTLNKIRLGEHSRCPVSTDMFVSGWKQRELESKGVPLVRFCAAMSDNSWFWFDPETGRRRADYQMKVDNPDGQLGAQFFFNPIPCFLAPLTKIRIPGGKAISGEIRPRGCVFRYNPLNGKPLSEGEGRALARMSVFSFGLPEEGGIVEDTEGLTKQNSRRLSAVKIRVIKNSEQ